MGSVNRRIDRIERRLRSGQVEGGWTAPLVEKRADEDPTEFECRLEAIRQRALASGWRPESGTPYAVIVEREQRTG